MTLILIDFFKDKILVLKIYAKCSSYRRGNFHICVEERITTLIINKKYCIRRTSLK